MSFSENPTTSRLSWLNFSLMASLSSTRSTASSPWIEHDGNSEVDQPAFVAHPETAILRDALLRDVELRHDFDARNDRGVVLLGNWLHGLLQHTVDAVFDHHIVLPFRCGCRWLGAPGR